MAEEHSPTPLISPETTKLIRTPNKSFDQSWAVIIGIDDYAQGIPPLRTAVNDARQLAQILAQQEYQIRLFDREVTRDALHKLLSVTLPRDIGENDRVFFYFAGHGIALDGDDGPAGYLIPQDAKQEDRDSFYPMHDVHQALLTLPCRHLLAILDCCFAGAFRWSSTRDIRHLPEVIHREQYDRFIIDPAWQVITSAAYDQKALDILSGDVYGSRGETKKHSPFARALFDALAGAGDVVPAGEGDGVITATELYLYLRYNVEILAEESTSRRQTPNLWPLNKHDRGEYIFLVPDRDLDLPPAPPLSFENNPYRGLQSYDEEHSELFFGRTALIEELAQRVDHQPLTVVLGASGTGKSSLVKAGLIPHLGGAYQPDGQERKNNSWFILEPFRPGASPLLVLNSILSKYLKDLVDGDIQDPSQVHTSALSDSITTWSKENPNRKFLLVIDQFEELITLCHDEGERETFLKILLQAVQDHPKVLRIVLTLRSDFEPQFSKSVLAKYWTPGRFVVTPMSQDELREVIEGPASVRVLYFEPYDLVEDLINEVILTPGALPLLSFTLSELYVRYIESRRDNRALTRDDYDALGGVVGSLRNRASAEYEQLDEPHRETMRRIMLRMVAVEGGELARRRAPRHELIYMNPEENERVETVLQNLVEARLLVEGQDESGTAYVEPAHDAMVRAWDRLLIWQRQAEEYLPLQRRVAQAAVDWDHTADEKAKTRLLWNNNPRLPQVQEAAVMQVPLRRGIASLAQQARRALWPTLREPRRNTWLNRLEMSFVRESVVRQAKVLRRVVFTTISVILALSALTIFALISRDIAVKSEAEAINQRNRAISRQLAGQSLEQASRHPDLALLLGIESIRLQESGESHRALLSVLTDPYRPKRYLWGHTAPIVGLAFSSDGQYLISSSTDGERVTWDTQSWEPETEQLDSLEIFEPGDAFSNDRTLRASVSDDGSVIVWDENDQTQLKRIDDLPGQVLDVDISPDGKLLAIAGSDLVITDLDGNTVAKDEGIRPSAVAFSSDGRYLAALDFYGSISIRGVAKIDKVITRLVGHSTSAFSLEFSPDGYLLASGGGDGTIIIHDLQANIEIASKHYAAGTSAVSFSPDGRLLAFADERRAIILQDARTGNPVLGPLAGHDETINVLEFSPNGQILASAGHDLAINLWDVRTGELIGEPLLGHEETVLSMVFSPDGSKLISGSPQGELIIWDIASGDEIGNFSQTDKHSLAVAVFDEHLSAWAGDLGEVLLAEVTEEGLVIDNLERPRGESNLYSVAIDPDKNLVAAGDSRGNVFLWSIKNGELTAFPLTAAQEEIAWTVEFSPDSSLLAAGTSLGGIRVWDIESELQIFTALIYEYGWILDFGFSPDGDLLVSAGHDGLFFWDLNVETWIKLACRIANRNLTIEEWNRYIGSDLPYKESCPSNVPYDDLDFDTPSGILDVNGKGEEIEDEAQQKATTVGDSSSEDVSDTDQPISIDHLFGKWRIVWDRGTADEETLTFNLDNETQEQMSIKVTSTGVMTFTDDEGCDHIGNLSENEDFASGIYMDCDSYPDWVGEWEASKLSD